MANGLQTGFKLFVGDAQSLQLSCALSGHMQHVFSFEIAFKPHAIGDLEQPQFRCRQLILQLAMRPSVERSFFLLTLRVDAVRIKRRHEGAILCGHLAQHKLKRRTGCFCMRQVPCRGERVHQSAGNQRLVVKHLLKMRHAPVFIQRVAVKTAAQMIMDTTANDGVQGGRHSLGGRGIIMPGALMLKIEHQGFIWELRCAFCAPRLIVDAGSKVS